MSLSREAMLDVMAYVDGELDGDALDRVESLLASDEEAARLALEMRTLGDCVRVVQSDRALQKNPDDIASDVMRALENNVVPLAPVAVRRRNAFLAGSVSTVLAAAAGWLLFVHHAPNDVADVSSVAQASATAPLVAPTQTPTAAPVDVAPEQMAAQAGQADVESVESPSHDVSVFYVPSNASANPNASSVVVWIGEGEATK